jgi:hypothetical protein
MVLLEVARQGGRAAHQRDGRSYPDGYRVEVIERKRG